jgi:hypothetical protein
MSEMSEMSEKPINFMGVATDSKGSKNPLVLRALAYSTTLLDIFKFIEVTEFKLNMVMFDYFWQVMVGNTQVHHKIDF